jgi:DNA-binding NtrC family response regulator
MSNDTDTVRLQERPERESAPVRVGLIVYGRSTATAVTLAPGESLVIGRSRPADVAIGEPSVSRTHARVTARDDGVAVEDLGSLNGTTINGTPVDSARATFGDVLLLGDVRVGLHALADGARRLAGFVAHDEIVARLDEEVARARQFGRTVSLALLRARGHVDEVALSTLRGLRRVDRAGLYSERVLELLLPEVDRGEVDARMTELCAAYPELRTAVVSFPADGSSADELVSLANEALRGEGGGARGGPLVLSDNMRALYATVDRAARATLPALVTGETGSGKELVARALHERGARRQQPFVVVNCAALPSELVESTLFGHEKGAFTGADARREGVFEAADSGTVFLDEIGELPAAAQAALLRVLETGRLSRVGGSAELETDVRVVAATHRDLEEMVDSGSFRQDLLYRLNALTVHVPPLRERPEEIEPLARRFLQDAAGDDADVARELSDATLTLLRGHSWPGNVRELKNAMERAAVIASGATVEPDDLPERVLRGGRVDRAVAPDAPVPLTEDEPDADYRGRVKRYERRLMLDALAATGGVLQLPLRTFVHKLKALGIKRSGPGYTVDDEI